MTVFINGNTHQHSILFHKENKKEKSIFFFKNNMIQMCVQLCRALRNIKYIHVCEAILLSIV